VIAEISNVRLRVVVVTGIFPPDIGGPATHAADLRDELRHRGHDVVVLTFADGPGRAHGDKVMRWPRTWRWPARFAAVIWWLVRNRRRYDVIYATGLHVPAVAGARMAGRPVVVKIVADPAWERATRLGLAGDDFETYQQTDPKSRRDRLMRTLRDWTVKRATAVTVPSESLAGVVRTWQSGVGPPVRRIPNGVVVPTGLPQLAEASSERLDVVFVGRLVPVKRIDLLLRAVALCEGVHLAIVGDGPERESLVTLAADLAVADRVRFLGALSQKIVLAELARAHALVMASEHEGLPHVVLEALTMGTPVVASPAGGTTEVIVNGENGRLVEASSPEAFAKVLAELRDAPEVWGELAVGARASGAHWRFERCADAVEDLLHDLSVPVKARRPRLISVGKGHKGWDSGPTGVFWERQFAVLSRHFDVTSVCVDSIGVRRVYGARILGLPSLRPRLLCGVFFYSLAPIFATAMAVARAGSVVVCQSPFEAFGVLLLRHLVPSRRRPRVVIEVHGDWRTASRLYGHRWRRLLSPLADGMAAWSVRWADRVRVIGAFTEDLVRGVGRRGPLERYVAFSDYGEFLGLPVTALPRTPGAAFIGVLEPYKAPDLLIAAWAVVHDRLPQAKLRIAGAGPMGEMLRRQVKELGLEGFVDFLGHVPSRRVVELLDSSTCMVLPSPSEGLGRVILEAMARNRPVVGSRSGGIPELVEDGVTGRLFAPGNPEALADVLVELLTQSERAWAMGREGRVRVEARDPAAEFEAGVERLAAWVSER
jgi:glycosyltransferase involved in cell wall biosynthesis